MNKEKQYKDYYWLNKESRLFLSRGYLKKNQLAEDRIKEIATYAENILKIDGFANKIIEYSAKGFYSFSTPVWSNFGDEKKIGISCFGSYIEDSLDSILNGGREIGMMSKYGGGTSMYLGELRPRGSDISMGGKADGATHYAQIYDTIVDKCKQSDTRRGSCAIYLPADHGDIDEFLNIGIDGNPIQKLQNGVCVSDEFMKQMINGDIDKRKIWSKILKRRSEIGFPYIFFTDNVNNNTPYKEYGLKIKHSNLCTEIALPNNIKESFVCCIGSINLLHWDDIIKTDAIETYVLFLNAVMDDFINKAEYIKGLKRAWRFAKDHRSIGLGVLGYHSLLQSKLIPFESLEAKQLNNHIFKTLKERSDNASKELYNSNPEKYQCIRRGFANSTLMAIAPTKSSSFILGQVSLGIEPIMSNYFIKDVAKNKSVFKNKILEDELEKYGLNTPETWKDILANNGSVQHLDFPTKEVFKSFIEISPKEIILQAAQRQKYIDQSQSVNLMIHPSISAKDRNKLYIYAWESGIKTLYYQYNESAAQSYARNINECVSCEG